MHDLFPTYTSLQSLCLVGLIPFVSSLLTNFVSLDVEVRFCYKGFQMYMRDCYMYVCLRMSAALGLCLQSDLDSKNTSLQAACVIVFLISIAHLLVFLVARIDRCVLWTVVWLPHNCLTAYVCYPISLYTDTDVIAWLRKQGMDQTLRLYSSPRWLYFPLSGSLLCMHGMHNARTLGSSNLYHSTCCSFVVYWATFSEAGFFNRALLFEIVSVVLSICKSTVQGTHVGCVRQCLHKHEPCGFSTLFSVSVTTNGHYCLKL